MRNIQQWSRSCVDKHNLAHLCIRPKEEHKYQNQPTPRIVLITLHETLLTWYQIDRLDPDSREKDVMTKEEAKGRKVGCPSSKGVLVGGGKGRK